MSNELVKYMSWNTCRNAAGVQSLYFNYLTVLLKETGQVVEGHEGCWISSSFPKFFINVISYYWSVIN